MVRTVVRSLVGFLGAALVGAVSGAAGVLVHQLWWGLALALAAALVTTAWLPAGSLRVGFAFGWMLAVSRATLTLPGGDYLISADAAGWSLLAGSLVLLVAALVTVGRRPGRADDRGDRGSAT